MAFSAYIANFEGMSRLEFAKRRYNVESSNIDNMILFAPYELTSSKGTMDSMNESLLDSFVEFDRQWSAISIDFNDIGSENDSVNERPNKKRMSSINWANRIRPYQAEQWQERFNELIEFRKVHGHCLVPHTYPCNTVLARWVKRQRCQYKLLREGRPSSMTQDRINFLQDIGFVWDSHEAGWKERLSALIDFKTKYGNCLVPSNCPTQQRLATWVKSQRRQYKLYREGRPSNMTADRIMILEKHGFEWELRSSSCLKKFARQERAAGNSILPFECKGDGEYDPLDLLSSISDDDEVHL